MPVDAILRDDLERRKAQWDLGFETKELLRRAFRKIVDAESMVESMRQRISREPSISLRKAFDSLDWLGRGFLTSSEFKRAFEWQQNIQSQIGSYSVSAFVRQDSVEMEALIRRFNKDKLNGRVSLPEFLDELTPKVPEKPY
jgi:Ca2+-binding EF-hand superfamily protein